MGVGAGLCMCSVAEGKFKFAISSDEFLIYAYLGIRDCCDGHKYVLLFIKRMY